ncbi:hypothetical protein EJ03DRAFT_326248 [Teratosphaeria nubilosa]|uniref:Zinc finger PHD-type domain-containing protein n=1 Tax=Teratosphaeria nubilosa TaxID=161662 RepID=A0A6G1LCP2_9PEZI|nr:hypothetical protein EJ03DRAFT_326248 [Teratosphaeria nubilosa]
MPLPERRSARGAPAPTRPAPPTSTASATSLSSGRQARDARSGVGQQKSATPHSRSSEEMSEPPRRSQRATQQPKEEEAVQDVDPADDGAGDEEDVTRCICGHQEYPGPPLSEAFSGVDALNEDTGGLFIQCDGCSVWQHGGCVGIIDEAQSPDKYYCEDCKPKEHRMHTDTRGQKYSLYLPVTSKQKRKTSMTKSDEKARKERDELLNRASTEPGRRRGTQRSKEHDDEEEQLRRALEESKREAGGGNGKRNGKRSRDDSEDIKSDNKRQRTVPESIMSSSRTAAVEDDTDDDTPTASRKKKLRAEAVQTARQAEVREKEKERELARAEAAGRRQDRAGRRRGDDPEQDETPKPTNHSKPSPLPSSQPGSPPTQAAPTKKPIGKKIKKLGNNQYTKYRDLANQHSTSSPQSKKKQLAGNASSGDEHAPNAGANGSTSNGPSKNSPGHEAVPSKSKLGKGRSKLVNGHGKGQTDEPVEMSINNMKRALEHMAGFMQRAQVDMAGDRTPPNGELGRIGSDEIMGMGTSPDDSTSASTATGNGEKGFAEMNSMEMAVVIERNIEAWNRRFGHLTA